MTPAASSFPEWKEEPWRSCGLWFGLSSQTGGVADPSLVQAPASFAKSAIKMIPRCDPPLPSKPGPTTPLAPFPLPPACSKATKSGAKIISHPSKSWSCQQRATPQILHTAEPLSTLHHTPQGQEGRIASVRHLTVHEPTRTKQAPVQMSFRVDTTAVYPAVPGVVWFGRLPCGINDSGCG
jgi:hypothetical protein